MRGGVLQLHRWGLLDRVVGLGTPAVRRTVFHYGTEAIDIAIRPADGVDALYAPRRTVFDSMLVDAARGSGAEIRHGHTVSGLIRRDDGRVAGATLVDAEGRCLEVTADLVVGADGTGSAVARLVEAPVQRAAQHATAVIYGHWSGLGDASAYHWHYVERAGAGMIPTNGGAHCIFVAVPPARFRDELRQHLAAGFHQVLGEVSPALAAAVGALRLEGGLWAFAGRKGFMRQPCGPGWALVGDAGYFKDPLTAHGITDALRDAELLADTAAQGTAQAFADYAALRDTLSVPLFEATDAIASFDWDLDAVKGHHQALNQAMKREVAHLAARGAVAPPAPRQMEIAA